MKKGETRDMVASQHLNTGIWRYELRSSRVWLIIRPVKLLTQAGSMFEEKIEELMDNKHINMFEEEIEVVTGKTTG
jgi:hypothetical protein